MRRGKRAALGALCLAMALLLCGCKQNPPPEKLYAKLLAHFEDRGYACELMPVADAERDVPIYNASAWSSLWLTGEGAEREEVLVYFDESNRADYLSEGIGEESGFVTRFGLRFVLAYQGSDEGVLKALGEIVNE